MTAWIIAGVFLALVLVLVIVGVLLYLKLTGKCISRYFYYYKHIMSIISIIAKQNRLLVFNRLQENSKIHCTHGKHGTVQTYIS